MPISAIDAINPSVQHATQQLFHPFRISQWVKLAFVGFLAGELSSGGCNGNFNMPGGGGGTPHHFPLPHIDPAAIAGIIAILAAFALVIWILFIYVNSVMRFILFDSVLTRRCEIRRGWSNRQNIGFRYFLWQIGFTIAMLVVMIFLIGVPVVLAAVAGWFRDPKAHIAPLILGGMFLFFMVAAVVLLSLVIHVFTKDFVIPQMALENIGAVEAWRRLLPMLKAEKGSYAGYVGMKVIMAMGAAVIVGIISFIIVLLILIPAGGVSVVTVLAGKAVGLQWNAFTITAAVVVVCMVMAVLLYIISLISVPVIVFFPAYSMYFFASRYPPLDRILHPAAPAPAAPLLAQPFIPPPEPIG